MTRLEALIEDFTKYRGKFSTEHQTALRYALGWADKHPDISVVSLYAFEAAQRDTIDRACEWLNEHIPFGETSREEVIECINNFKQAMQQ